MSGNSELFVDDHTKARQREASSPDHSAWVSANAGSGKTTVLARRVVRLLLNGFDPSRLLCITYTKAAAGEMANRVFDILSEWATLPNDALHEKLTDIEGHVPTPTQMQLARTLFARALETPGGIKIQTIHAFCSALLHQFPIEANVPGTFSEMDDTQQAIAIEAARRAVILEAHNNPDGDLGKAFAGMLAHASDAAIERALKEAIGRREEIEAWLKNSGGPAGVEQQLRTALGFTADETVENLLNTHLAQCTFTDQTLAEMARLGHTLTAKPKAIAAKINGFLSESVPLERFEKLCGIFFTSKGAPYKYSNFGSTEFRNAFAGFEQGFDTETLRLIDARERVSALKGILATCDVMIFVQSMLTRYREEKRRKGLLDFDDLISRTAELLHRRDASAWVLYKMDQGIDHLLIDEAQDTSPRQWQVITALVSEFFSGQGARAVNRTVFAVGDEKQSIYSFQGARPESFDAQRRLFQRQASNAGKKLLPAQLGLSFRSTIDVLSAVDKVFDRTANEPAVAMGGNYQAHTAARRNDPGQVEVWPMVQAETIENPEEWHVAVTQSDNRHQAVLLARRIAEQVHCWISNGERFFANGKPGGKPIGPGDILVLVRARDRFTTALSRALKDFGIPVAGADRLKLTDHIAIQDLLALGRTMVTAQDDLSLAALLKSPLFNVDEAALFELSQSRFDAAYEMSLFEALNRTEDEALKAVLVQLMAWRKRVDAMPVYEFYAQILGADGGRHAFLSRLGAETNDVLDAFLAQALEHERGGLPGLQAFVEKLQSADLELKREQDQTAGEVRIMTVHAAKGLEAPIVFLVDKGSAPFVDSKAPCFYELLNSSDNQSLMWVPQSAFHIAATRQSLQLEKKKAEDEYRRLLYVGMTRARDRLIICGYQGKTAPGQPTWRTLVDDALKEAYQEEFDGEGNLQRAVWTHSKPPAPMPNGDDNAALSKISLAVSLPDWVRQKLPREPGLPRPLSPSGAQALIDESRTKQAHIVPLTRHSHEEDTSPSARQTGTAIHRLFQVLPEIASNERRLRARAYLENSLIGASAESIDNALSGIFAVLDNPDFAPWFEPATSRAEVPVMGRIETTDGPRSISGTIDRLVVQPRRVLLIDFKTGAHVPAHQDEIPGDYVMQMTLYRHLVSRIYPELPVEAVLIWTSGRTAQGAFAPRVDLLDEASMDAALRQLGSS